MRKYWVVVAVVVTTLGGHALIRGRAAGSSSDQRLVARVVKLEQRLRALEQDRREGWSESLALALLAKSESEDGAEVAQAPALEVAERAETQTDDSSPEAHREAMEAFLQGFDEVVATEAEDRSWSLPTLSEARATIADALPGAKILEESCGGDVCRLLVEHALDDNLSPETRDLHRLPPFDQGCVVMHTPSHGEQLASTRLYIRRPELAQTAP